jgi:hypothetical protein
MDASSSAQVNPKIVLSSIDADVVKSYVEFGLGIAVQLSVAYERNAIADCVLLTPLICSRDDSSNRAVSREVCARLQHDVIDRLAPQWDPHAVEVAMRSKSAPRE